MSKDIMNMIGYLLTALVFLSCYYRGMIAKDKLIKLMYMEVNNLGGVLEPTRILYKSSVRWVIFCLIGVCVFLIKFFHSF